VNCNLAGADCVLPVGQVGTGWEASVLQLSMEWGEVCHQCLILSSRWTSSSFPNEGNQ